MKSNLYIINSPSYPNKRDFEYCAVWCEWYSSEEIPYLKSLYISEQEFEETIIKPHDDGKETYYPILETNILPYREFLYIMVVVKVADGVELGGYVSVFCDEVVAVTIWIDAPSYREFKFLCADRLCAEDENPDSIELLSEILEIEPFSELHYHSEYRLSNGNLVSGSIDLELSEIEQEIFNVDWDTFNGPELYDATQVAPALIALLKLDDRDKAEEVGDKIINTIGNNHTGTYYPAIVKAIDFIIYFAKNSKENRVREGCTEAILNNLYYFNPELGEYNKFSYSQLQEIIRERLSPYSDR